MQLPKRCNMHGNTLIEVIISNITADDKQSLLQLYLSKIEVI